MLTHFDVKASLFRFSPGSNSPALHAVSLVYVSEVKKNTSGTIKAYNFVASIGDLHFSGIYFGTGVGCVAADFTVQNTVHPRGIFPVF